MSTDDLVLDVSCPFCKAEAGQPCRAMAGESVMTHVWPHLERIRAHYRALR